MNQQRMLRAAFLSLFATSAMASGPVYDFENGSSEQWTGANVVADGPWAVNEWASNGGSSLKANVQLSPGKKFYLKLTQDLDLSEASTLSASVKISEWADFGQDVSVVIYVKTGKGWAWHSSNPAGVNAGSEGSTLTFDLSQVADLASTREIGIELIAGEGAAGEGAIYVDNVKVDNQAVTQVKPLWSLSRNYTVFDNAGYPLLLENGEVRKLSPANGEVVWSHSVGGADSFNRDGQTILYVSDAMDLVSVSSVTGQRLWQHPVDNRYFKQLSSTDDVLYIQDNDVIKAISKKDGKTLWNHKKTSFGDIHFHHPDYILVQSGFELRALDRINGKVLWQYDSSDHPFYNVDKNGDIWVRNGANHAVLGLLNKDNGSFVWQSNLGVSLEDMYTDSPSHVYFVSGSYNERVLSAIDKTSGKLAWQSEPLAYFRTHYELSGAVFLHSGSSFHRIDVTTGGIAWTVDSDSIHFDTLGALYTTERRSPEINVLSKINKQTGAVQWSTVHKAVGIDLVKVADEKSLILKTNNGYTKVDSTSGAALWHYSHGSRSARYLGKSQTTLYFAAGLNLYALDLETGGLQWQLPLDSSVHSKHQSDDYIFFEYDSASSGGPYGLIALEK